MTSGYARQNGASISKKMRFRRVSHFLCPDARKLGTYLRGRPCRANCLVVLASAGGCGVPMKSWILVLAFFVSSGSFAQQTSTVFSGGWTATAGPTQILRGTWSAQSSPNRPNVARGSWTLLNESGEILLQGTWSAQKTGQGWEGTWSARPASGQLLAGTWTADAAKLNAKTLSQMLTSTVTKEAAGWWQSGRYQGNWWLKGTRK